MLLLVDEGDDEHDEDDEMLQHYDIDLDEIDEFENNHQFLEFQLITLDEDDDEIIGIITDKYDNDEIDDDELDDYSQHMQLKNERKILDDDEVDDLHIYYHENEPIEVQELLLFAIYQRIKN